MAGSIPNDPKQETSMSDQADKLRHLVRASRAATLLASTHAEGARRLTATEPTRTTRSLLFTSGKGGVGTSNLVLNLAITLGEMGQRVVVVDADLGLANLDLLCGLAPRYDLGDVLCGRCQLREAVVMGPGDIQILPGAHAIRTHAEDLSSGPTRLAAELRELESEADYVLVDGGSGLGPGITTLAAAADEVVVVSTPEPTSIADAHAAISRLQRLPASPRMRVLVNQVTSRVEARDALDRLVASSRQFLGAVVLPLGPGWVRADPHVPLAVRTRRPFSAAYPAARASRGVRRVAKALIRERHPPLRHHRAGFFTTLVSRWAHRRPFARMEATRLES
jgi:flagellar biosynthesis protein FlhG